MNGFAMTSSTPPTPSKGNTMTRSKLVRRTALAAVSLLGVVGGSLSVHADTLSQRVLAGTLQNTASAMPTGGFPKIPLTCDAASPTCTVGLAANASTVTVHDSVNGTQTVPVWAFGVNGAPVGLAGTPASIIKVRQGTTLTINVSQGAGTGSPIDLVFPDLPLSAVSHTGTSYTVQANEVGTTLFEPGTNADAPKQIDMGLVGILIVVPTSCTDSVNYACAYDGTAYNHESVVAFNTVDAEFAANPSGFEMSYFGQARTADNKPRKVYHMINGKSFPDTDLIDVLQGNSLLIRYVNAGEAEAVPNLVGISQSVLGRNNSPYSDPQQQVAPLIMAGETVEATLTVPRGAVAPTGQKYALTNQVRDYSHGNQHGFSGALTFISVWSQ
jgi:hypothetical protein